MDLRSDQGEIGSVDSLGEVFAGPLVTAKAVGVGCNRWSPLRCSMRIRSSSAQGPQRAPMTLLISSA